MSNATPTVPATAADLAIHPAERLTLQDGWRAPLDLVSIPRPAIELWPIPSERTADYYKRAESLSFEAATLLADGDEDEAADKLREAADCIEQARVWGRRIDPAPLPPYVLSRSDFEHAEYVAKRTGNPIDSTVASLVRSGSVSDLGVA